MLGSMRRLIASFWGTPRAPIWHVCKAAWESLGIFEIQSSLPLTDSDTNQHNNLEMVDKYPEALKIIYLKSERTSFLRK